MVSGYDLETPLAQILGEEVAGQFARGFEYHTAGDLLWHLPRRYTKRGELTPLAGLPLGEHVTIVGQILSVQNRRMASRGGSILTVQVTDGTGFLTLTFFNQAWREKELQVGRHGQFAGKVGSYRGQLQLSHPDYQLFELEEAAGAGVDAEKLRQAAARAYAKRLVPSYPASVKLPSWSIAAAIKKVLEMLPEVAEPLPPEVLAEAEIIPLDAAFRLVHAPDSVSDWKAARQSLKYREAFDLQLALCARAAARQDEAATPRPAKAGGVLERFDAGLSYQLTVDQAVVGAEFASQLAAATPMARLLQGEVGSGKTLVALRAMLQVADTGGQSALLAPTEVLAAQHYRSITELLGRDLVRELRPVLITGSLSAAERKYALLRVVAGDALLVIGTHALFSESTKFADLGLVVVDEQHRFGVEQREQLRLKGRTSPHLLAMTATPIPRTVALTAFGELEVATLRQLPAGRQGIESFAVQVRHQPAAAARVWQRALQEIAAGRQVYVVCPAISVSENAENVENAPDAGDGAKNAQNRAVSGDLAGVSEGDAASAPRNRAGVAEIAAMIAQRPDFAGVRIAQLTGAMPADEKDTTMRAFAAGEIDLLVATTVIEVGVNVPNATMMIVLEADRFGVSQLHQLRGRVGRGQFPGLCLLLTEAGLESPAWQRVEAVAATNDGFALAEIDLQQRCEGDILGTAQSGGRSTLRLLRVVGDGEIITHARAQAQALLDRDPELSSVPLLAKLLASQAEKLAQIDKT